MLSYYKDPVDPQAAGVIPVGNCSVTLAEEKLAKKYAFEIATRYRNYFLVSVPTRCASTCPYDTLSCALGHVDDATAIDLFVLLACFVQVAKDEFELAKWMRHIEQA